MNFLVFFTAVVGSVASSRTMTLSFSPAISLGQSAMPFLVGMPSAEVGPVSEMLAPIVMSARALPAPSARARAAALRVNAFIGCLLRVYGKGRVGRAACVRCGSVRARQDHVAVAPQVHANDVGVAVREHGALV